MNENKFKEMISKIATWYIPFVKDGRSHDIKITDDETINPNTGIVIEEFITPPQPCNWCGKIVKQKTLFQHVTRKKTNESFWVGYCKTCEMYKNHYTGEMQEDSPTNLVRAKNWSENRRDAQLKRNEK